MKKLYLILIFLGCLSLAWQTLKAHKNISISGFKRADCFVINTSDMTIKEASCGNNVGSVTGIKIDGEGKFSYAWKDELGRIVGNNLELKNVSAGNYVLEVKGTGDCPMQTYPLTIDEKNSIGVDLTGIKVVAADCNNKGSVLGIKITGANRLEWRSFTTGMVVSTSEDMVSVPVGLYKLTAFNQTGCIKDAGIFSVSSQTVLPIIEKVEITDPTCGQLQGKAVLTLTVLQDQETLNYYVFDRDDLQVLDGLISYNKNVNAILLNFNLGPGSYRVFVRGKSGCNILLTSFKITQGVLSLASDSIGVFNDQCNQHIGHILGIQIKGISKPPKGRIIEWTDEKGHVVGGNFPYLTNIGAGKYTMHFTDPAGCKLDTSFIVRNESPDLVQPKLSGANICLPGSVFLMVENIDTAGTYRLYDSPDEGSFAVAESKSGRFTIPVLKTTNYYVSFLQGICESEKTLVTVNVAAPGIKIPNTFTPNGDGVNDIWNITALENYPGTIIKIYNRYGNLIYSSVDYKSPFNGIRDGKDVPAGVYYYKIEIKRVTCEGKINGSLTILR